MLLTDDNEISLLDATLAPVSGKRDEGCVQGDKGNGGNNLGGEHVVETRGRNTWQKYRVFTEH